MTKWATPEEWHAGAGEPVGERLTSVQMARFVADGYLRFDEIVPEEINRAGMAEFEAGALPTHAGYEPDVPVDSLWSSSDGVGAFLRLPAVQAIIRSLVGDSPTYDHHAVHVRATDGRSQFWHADAIIDTRTAFDIQIMWYPHDTPREMGGTMILPGSHFRRISESDICRYHNFVGQVPMVCKAGTVMVLHHGMWHCGQPNNSDRKRYMFKIRMNATVPQVRLWDTSDLNDPRITDILQTHHMWYGTEIRLEQVNRVKLWRHLIGDPEWDMLLWLTRLENHAS